MRHWFGGRFGSATRCVGAVSQRTVALLAGDTLDVDDVLLAVHLDDLALTAAVGSTDHDDLVILADWHSLNLIGRAR